MGRAHRTSHRDGSWRDSLLRVTLLACLGVGGCRGCQCAPTINWFPATCGVEGAPCCSSLDGGVSCESGVCTWGWCRTASCIPGQPCCDGGPCPPPPSCGFVGQACCSASYCLPGSVCSDRGDGGLCARCGRRGEPCCAGAASVCESGSRCVDAVCRGCGAPGEACCAGNACQLAARCVPMAGELRCVRCGIEGERCCAAGACEPNTRCLAPTDDPADAQTLGDASDDVFADDAPDAAADVALDGGDAAVAEGLCLRCGDLTQACCPGRRCPASARLVCVASDGLAGRCVRCGAANAPCCPAEGGLACNAGMRCVPDADGAPVCLP